MFGADNHRYETEDALTRHLPEKCPHPEGLAEPRRYVDEIKDMPLEQQAKIMGGNLARLLAV